MRKRNDSTLLKLALGFIAGYLLAKEGVSLGEMARILAYIRPEVEQENTVK